MAVKPMTASVVALFSGVLLLASVLASKVSSKLGIPALLFFLALGMLAGSEGPGGIDFENFELTKTIGAFTLCFVLFSGGLDTDWNEIKRLLWRGISLATVGSLVTMLLVGLFAHFFLGLELIQGLILGAVVSPTDAAAIFSVLHSGQIQLKRRLVCLLELESGTNDPMSIFLVIGFISLALNAKKSIAELIPLFFQQMTVGFFIGAVLAYIAVWLINNLRLEYDGLYPVLTSSFVIIAYGICLFLGGNEFLAVYVMGVLMGKHNFVHKLSLIQFHDGLGWLVQIAIFLILGLLVFPSRLLPIMLTGIGLSTFLIFIARPTAVFISLLLTKGMKKREKLFISWAGLRGAWPIILATFSVIEKIPHSDLMFNIVFFVVLTSVLVQGTTLRFVAKYLGVLHPRTTEEPDAKPAGRTELLELKVEKSSPAADKQVVELNLPRSALIVLLRRGETAYIPHGRTVIRPGDIVVLATRKEDWDELKSRFVGKEQAENDKG